MTWQDKIASAATRYLAGIRPVRAFSLVDELLARLGWTALEVIMWGLNVPAEDE